MKSDTLMLPVVVIMLFTVHINIKVIQMRSFLFVVFIGRLALQPLFFRLFICFIIFFDTCHTFYGLFMETNEEENSNVIADLDFHVKFCFFD